MYSQGLICGVTSTEFPCICAFLPHLRTHECNDDVYSHRCIDDMHEQGKTTLSIAAAYPDHWLNDTEFRLVLNTVRAESLPLSYTDLPYHSPTYGTSYRCVLGQITSCRRYRFLVRHWRYFWRCTNGCARH